MASPHRPHKQHPIRERRANPLVVGAAIGAFLGVVVIGTHISEWPASKSLSGILAAAAIGIAFAYIATNFPRPSSSRSGSEGVTNDSPSFDSESYYDGSGHFGGHDGGSSCGSDFGGGDCGGD